MRTIQAHTTKLQKQGMPVRCQAQETAPQNSAAQLATPQIANRRPQVNRNRLTPVDLLALQRTIGNRQVQQMLTQSPDSANELQQSALIGGNSRPKVQPKLTVGAPGDVYEQEADRVASVINKGGRAGSIEGIVDSTRVSRNGGGTGQKMTAERFPWIGRITGTYSAALRREPYKNRNAPHAGTLADLPEGEFVDVIGRKGSWLHVRATVNGADMEGFVSQELVAFNRWDIAPKANTAPMPVVSSAGSGFDQFLLQFEALEQAAIAEGYGFNERITAFRKLYYDSKSATKTYAGATIGGGVWNILIPGAAGTTVPQSWSTPALQGAGDHLRKNQVLSIGGQSVDIGHMLAGADAAKHPTSISLGGGTIKLRSNVEAATFIGDLGSVVTEYIHGSTASFHDVAMKRSTLLESYYDGASGMASMEDMAGNADAYSFSFNSSKTLTENLRDYYTASTGGVKKRFTTFASLIGLGALKGTTFTGDTKAWRDTMQEEVFNSALAYAAGKGWKTDVINVLKDPGPGLFSPTFWEMYWNNAEWVVDIFVNRMTRDVAKE